MDGLDGLVHDTNPPGFETRANGPAQNTRSAQKAKNTALQHKTRVVVVANPEQTQKETVNKKQNKEKEKEEKEEEEETLCEDCKENVAAFITGCSGSGFGTSWAMYVCEDCCIRVPAEGSDSTSSEVYACGDSYWTERL